MRRLAIIAPLSFAVVLSFGSAHAGPSANRFGTALRTVLSGSFVMPPEWDGVWTTSDSTYDCTAGFTQYGTDADTICGGQAYSNDSPGPMNFSCDGNADATSIHATCTGGYQIFPECQATYLIQVDLIRTGDTYRSVTTVTVTYSGTGTGCSFIPGSCTRIVSYGTRTGPGPKSCVTSVNPTSWGRLKIRYR